MKTKTTFWKLLGVCALVLMLGFAQYATAATVFTQNQTSVSTSYGLGTVNQRLLEVKVTPTVANVTVTNLQFTLTNPEQIAKVSIFVSSNGIPDLSGSSFGTATNPTASVSINGSLLISNTSYRSFYLLVDIKPTATIGTQINAVCTSVVADITETPTAVTNSKTVLVADNLTGTKTVSTTGTPDYASLNAAITDLNNYGVGTGGVTFSVADGETFSAHSTLGYSYYLIRQSGTATNPIVFKQSGTGAKPIISMGGTGSSSDCFIGAMGVDYLTIDGLQFINSNTIKLEKPIFFVSMPGHGCSHNEVKNCVVDANNTYSATAVWGITFQSKATSAAEANSYNKIHHNTISNTNIAIDFGLGSTSPTANDTGNEIYINNITGAFNTAGIYLKYCSDTKVYNNVLDGGATASTAGNTRTGIDGSSSTNSGTIDCYGNTVKNISINVAQTLSGISLLANTVNIYNNVIANVANNFTTAHTKGSNGILMGSAATLVPTYNVYHNSIYMNQTAANTTARTTCIAQEGTTAANVTAMNLINNICVNNSSTGSPSNYTLYIPSIAAKLGATTDNNLYFPETIIRVGGSNSTDLAAYKSTMSAAGIEQNSVTGDPLFVAKTTGDLTITDVLSPVNNKGKPVASVTTDILDNARSEYKPDMGAYEFDKFSTSAAKLNENNSQIYSRNASIIVNLTNIESSTTISIMDTKGAVLKTLQSNGSELLSIPVANKGIYMVRIQNEGKNTVKKVVLF